MPQPPMPFGFALPEQFRGQTLSTYQPTFREMATDYLRRMMFSDDREGQRKAERVSNVLETTTPFGFATGIDDAKEAFGQGDYLTGGIMGAMAMAPGPSPKIRAYHGTEAEKLFRFDPKFQGTMQGKPGAGFWFTSSPSNAAFYGPNIVSADVSMKNPMRMTAEEFEAGNGRGPSYWAKIAREKGHDGLIIEDIIDGAEPSTIYAVFDPKGIKTYGLFPAGEKDPF